MNIEELPGAELVLPGLNDLNAGATHTVEALLVAIAATRLTAAGLDVPQNLLAPEPDRIGCSPKSACPRTRTDFVCSPSIRTG